MTTTPQPPQQNPLVAKYQYNEHYQLRILALLVRYPNFIAKYGEVIRPEFFEQEVMAQLCKLILQFYTQYAVIPTESSLSAMVVDYCNRGHVHPKVQQQLEYLVAQICTMDLSDGDAIRDSAIEFAKRQSLKRAVIDIVDILDKHDGYEKASTLIQNALMVGQGIGSMGMEVYNSIPHLPGLLADNGPYATSRKIRTCFHSLDNARMGGIGPGECMVIVGSSGQGKSIIKTNLAYMASMQVQGQWIAHATLELSEVDNLLRYAARVLDINQEEIVKNTATYRESMTKIQQFMNARRVFIKWFPPVATTPSVIRSWISALSAQLGMGPGAIVIDYPDKMSPTKGLVDNLYVDVGRVYSELINLLHDYQMPGFFSSQIDRANQYSNTARSSSIANSIAKLYDADVVGTINQSEQDKQNGVGRIWWDKCRRGRDMFHSYFRINYSKCYVMEEQGLENGVQAGIQTR